MPIPRRRKPVVPRLSLGPGRTVLEPGWDDLPVDRPRARAGRWRRLLAGAAGNTRLQPGSCCGCGFKCGTCAIPQTDLTCSYSYTQNQGCCTGTSGSGSVTLHYNGSNKWTGTTCVVYGGCTACFPDSIAIAVLACTGTTVFFQLVGAASGCVNTGTTLCGTSFGLTNLTVNSLTCGSSFLMSISSTNSTGCEGASWSFTISP